MLSFEEEPDDSGSTEVYDEEIQSAAVDTTEDQKSVSFRDTALESFIGLASPRQWCFCCNLLYSLRCDMDDPPQLSRMHMCSQRKWDFPGVLTPWVPPPLEYGLPLRVVQEMATELFHLLQDQLEYLLQELFYAMTHPEAYGQEIGWELILLAHPQPSFVLQELPRIRRRNRARSIDNANFPLCVPSGTASLEVA
jgi:hypothetical protein